MGAGLFLIAIMGCGEADAPCSTLRTLEARYETRAACTAATAAALAEAGDADYPVVVAECVASGASPKVKPIEIKLPVGGRAALRVTPLRS
jgi:hypothetical protein